MLLFPPAVFAAVFSFITFASSSHLRAAEVTAGEEAQWGKLDAVAKLLKEIIKAKP